MNTIYISLEEILTYRREKNVELFMDQEGSIVNFYVQATEGITMCAKCSSKDPAVKEIYSWGNVPIVVRDKRLVSYDWTSTETWASSGEAKWIGEPEDGWKFIITSIQVRFPKSIMITPENRLYFKVHLFYPPYGAVVPVISNEYDSVRSLAKKSNNPLYSSPYAINNLATEELIEMEFVYADPYTLKGSPIVLRSTLNEFIEIGLTGNTPLGDIDGNPYDTGNETWCVINGKQVYDF